MKKTITFLLVILAFFVNAQVTEIYVPNTYDVNNNAGATVPFYQKDGFIYCISHKTISNAEGKIFKINQMTNAITEVQESNPFYFNSGIGDLPFYNGEYNDKVFFSVWQSYANMLNTSNNTLTTQYFQNGDINKVYQNYLVQGFNIKNIDTDVVSNIGTTDAVYNNQPTSIKVTETSPIYNSSFYASHQEYLPFIGTLGTNKIFKFSNGSSLNYSLEYIAPNNHYIQGVHNGVNTNELFQIGNKLIFSETIYPCCPYNSVLKSMDVNNNQINTILTATDAPQYIKSFIFNNELYFYLNSDTSFIKKTNGTNVVNTNLAEANTYGLSTSWYFPHSNFIEYQGNIYSLKYNGSSLPMHFFKFDGTNIINLTSKFTGIQKAIVHNNIMYFYGVHTMDNSVALTTGIFSYDGNTIRRLDLGTTPVEPVLNSSLYGYNNFLFFGNGQSLVKIDLNTVGSTTIVTNLSTLSTQENQKPTLKLYPNPTKSILNFSEELSEIKIVDMSGKQVSATPSKTKTISVENLPKGNYLISAKDKNGKTVTEKFIRE